MNSMNCTTKVTGTDAVSRNLKIGKNENNTNDVKISRIEQNNTEDLIDSNNDNIKKDEIRSTALRVTRSSPLLLNTSSIVKKEPLDITYESINTDVEDTCCPTVNNHILSNKRHISIRGRKPIKEPKEMRGHKEEQTGQDENTNYKDDEKDCNIPKYNKETTVEITKDHLKDKLAVSGTTSEIIQTATCLSPTSSTSSTTSVSRITRKSFVAQESNLSTISAPTITTRVTRQRQVNNTLAISCETQIGSNKIKNRSVTRNKLSITNEPGSITTTLSGRRKRSLDTCAIMDDQVGKYVKIENKDIDEEEVQTLTHITNSINDCVTEETTKVKQEIAEDIENEITEHNSTELLEGVERIVTQRVRGKWTNRKSSMILNNLSQSTRSTRQSKGILLNSVNSTTLNTSNKLPKRRRVTLNNNRSLLKSHINNNTTKKVQDEDSSKDSTTSFNMVLLTNIETNKSIETTSTKLNEKAKSENSSPTDDSEIAAFIALDEELLSANSLLTPVTATTAFSIVSETEKTQSESLSPSDLLVINEDVSEISLKQFCTKPKFLENNVGIERDPIIIQDKKKSSLNTESVINSNETFEKKIDKDKSCLLINAVQNDEHILPVPVGETSLPFISGENENMNIQSVLNHTGDLQERNDSLSIKANENKSVIIKKIIPDESMIFEDDDDDEDDDEGMMVIADDIEDDTDPMELPTPNICHTNNIRYPKSDDTTINQSNDTLAEDLDNNKVTSDVDASHNKFRTSPFKNTETQENVVFNSSRSTPFNEIKSKLQNNDNVDEHDVDSNILATNENRSINEENHKFEEHHKVKTYYKTGNESRNINALSKWINCDVESDKELLKIDQPPIDIGATQWITLDKDGTDEEFRQKEEHLENLGLITHKAAEKRRLEVKQNSTTILEVSKIGTSGQLLLQRQQQEIFRHEYLQQNSMSQQQCHVKRNSKNTSNTVQEYTGTLKTVIKLNRHSTGNINNTNGRKALSSSGNSSAVAREQLQQQSRRHSLKMTFQKGRARGGHTGLNSDRNHNERNIHDEDNYYTIQNENEVRSSTDCLNENSIALGPSSKKDEKGRILIPEKASSFKFHPGRLCEDQCFYCSGKFGLYDTPCHVGQIKSFERQQKILCNEEKLTVDNCLCDACFRHVDRRANVPSYKKRLSAPDNLEASTSTNSGLTKCNNDNNQIVNIKQKIMVATEASNDNTNENIRKCLVPDCTNPVARSLKRKCIRKSVKKFLLNFEMPNGVVNIWLCQSHYDAVIQCSGCVLCKRRLGKNHMYHITSDTDRLEKSLSELGIPVQLGIGTAVCKLCRYFANLLMKPPDSTKSQKAEFVKNYRKRLLQFHNIHDVSNETSEIEEEEGRIAVNNNGVDILSNPAQTSPKPPNSNAESTITKKSPSPIESDSTSIEVISENSTACEGINTFPTANNNEEAKEQTYDAATDTLDLSNQSSLASRNVHHSSGKSTETQQMSKLKAILQSNTVQNNDEDMSADISTVLRSNPNISMRELFPGEEDLGINFKVSFGSNISQRTPEGWTRVQTFLQYDEPTRRLWEELQKPYGNQSSFLRHLILLEKYFRNGDLILSANASSNASVYTETVRQRLVSFDHGHCGGLLDNDNSKCLDMTRNNSTTNNCKTVESEITTVEINEDDEDDDVIETSNIPLRLDMSNNNDLNLLQELAKGSLNKNSKKVQRSRSLSVDKLTKQLSCNSVTIIARPKDNSNKRTTPSPQKSLLKDGLNTSNNISLHTNSTPISMNTPIAISNAMASFSSAMANSMNSHSRSILKCNLLSMNKSVEILPINSHNSTSTSSTITFKTPALAPVTTTETKQQKILDVANKLLGNQLEAATVTQNRQTTSASFLNSPPELISLQRRTSINHSNAACQANSNKRSQVFSKTAGSSSSRPPPNVVVLADTLTPQERLQSKSWRPTLMPLEENLAHINKNGPLYQTVDGRRLPGLVQVQSGGKPFLISIFDYNRMCILRREKIMRDQMLKASKKRQESKGQQQQHITHQTQQKNNLQGINKSVVTSTVISNRQQQQQHQQQVAQQQLLQLQLLQHQQALLKAASAASSVNISIANRYINAAHSTKTSIANSNGNSNNSNRVPTSMPPLQATVNSTSTYPASIIPILANSVNTTVNVTTPASISNVWLWNNLSDSNSLLNGSNSIVGSSGLNIQKIPQLISKTNTNVSATITHANAIKQQQQLLLSKIPKSLTVIPQHKLMNTTAATTTMTINSSKTINGSSIKE